MTLDKEFYTIEELADLLQVTRMTIYRLRKKGDLPAHKIGDTVRFRKEDIEDFLQRTKD